MNYSGLPSAASPPPPDHYICFCSRPFLFHGVGSLQSATPSKDNESQQQRAAMQPQSATPAVVDLTRSIYGQKWEAGLQHHLRQAQDAVARQEAQASTETSRSAFSNSRTAITSQVAPETRHAGTSTSASAFWRFADTLDRFARSSRHPFSFHSANRILRLYTVIVIAVAATARFPCP